jgi:hypothetical protein
MDLFQSYLHRIKRRPAAGGPVGGSLRSPVLGPPDRAADIACGKGGRGERYIAALIKNVDRPLDGLDPFIERILPGDAPFPTEEGDSQLAVLTEDLSWDLHYAIPWKVELCNWTLAVGWKTLEDFEGHGDIFPKY